MPLLPLSLAFIVGIILASQVSIPAIGWLAGSLIFLILASVIYLISRRNPKLRPYPLRSSPGRPVSASPFLLRTFSPLLLLTALALGAARYQSSRPVLADPGFIAHYNDTGLNVAITGVVARPPDERDAYTNLHVQAETIRLSSDASRMTDPVPVSGLLLARLDPGADFQYGDRVILRGRLQTPPESETFSYRDYLAGRGIYAFLPFAEASLLARGHGNPIFTAIFALRANALDILYHLYPDPEAALLAGILLGVETGIPPALDQAFRDTGTAHIVAISGFNITIIAALFTSLFSRTLGARPGAVAAILAVAFYTLLVGADAAVVRAAIMGILAIFARQSRQPTPALGTLAFTAAVMAFGNPLIPWDAGFQLSFAATLGLILYADRLNRAFARFASRYLPAPTVERLTPLVGEFVLLTFAAQITTLPVVLYHFQRLSLTAFLANPVILPAQPFVMIFGGLTVLAGLLFLPLGQLLAPLAWVFVAFTIRVVEWFANLPGGVIATGQLSIPALLVFYLALFTLTLAGTSRRAPALAPTLPLVFLTLIATLTWRVALSASDGRLHLTLLDTGMGEAVLIHTPTGRRLLINGGSSPVRLSDQLGRRMVFGQTLDFLVISAPDTSHLSALPDVLERFPPDRVLWAGPQHANSAARFVQRTLARLNVPPIPAERGHALDLGGGASLRALTVGHRGAVLLLEWGKFRALLPAGLDFAAMDALQTGRAVGPVSVLLLAGNGLAALNPSEWIAHLNPQLILLSVEAGNREGLPSPETLDAVEGYTLLRTDLNGWIQIATDGERMWVAAERK